MDRDRRAARTTTSSPTSLVDTQLPGVRRPAGARRTGSLRPGTPPHLLRPAEPRGDGRRLRRAIGPASRAPSSPRAKNDLAALTLTSARSAGASRRGRSPSFYREPRRSSAPTRSSATRPAGRTPPSDAVGFRLADVDFTRELGVRDLALRQELALAAGRPPRRDGLRGPRAAHGDALAHRRRPQPGRGQRLERPGRGRAAERPRLGGGLDPRRRAGCRTAGRRARGSRWRRGSASTGAASTAARRCRRASPLTLRIGERDARCARGAGSSRRAPATRSSSSPTTSSTSSGELGALAALRAGHARGRSASSATSRRRRQRAGRGLLEGLLRPRRRPAGDGGRSARPRRAATTSRPSSPRASRPTPSSRASR